MNKFFVCIAMVLPATAFASPVGGPQSSDVAELSALKRESVGQVKQVNSVFSEVNGHKQADGEETNQVFADGEPLASFSHLLHDDNAAPQDHKEAFSLDVPKLGIHKNIIDDKNINQLVQNTQTDLERAIDSDVLREYMERLEDGWRFPYEDELAAPQPLELKRESKKRSWSGQKETSEGTLQTQSLSNEDLLQLVEMLDENERNEENTEELVYLLQKMILEESMKNGDTDVESTIDTISNFLDYEYQRGKLTEGLHKKLQDLLIEVVLEVMTENKLDQK